MGINRGRKDQIKGEVRVGDFSRAFGKEMIKYTLDVEEEIAEITATLTKSAAKELNVVSKSTFQNTGTKYTGYTEGWTAKNKSVRHRARWIIHNQFAPGLAHLLEHGHAKRGGGRVDGKTHIAPIEEKLIKDYEDNVKAIIENGVI